MNPIVYYCLEFLNIDKPDVELLNIEYKNGNIAPIASLYSFKDKEDSNYSIEIDPVKFCNLFSFLTKMELKNGVEYDSIYSNHRKINYLRFILPEGLVQIEFDDEPINLDLSLQICESMRETFILQLNSVE